MRLFRLLAALILLQTNLVTGATLDFDAPNSGSNYVVGAAINYRGSATWGNGGAVAGVQVDLLYVNGSGTEDIVDGESADLIFLSNGHSLTFLRRDPSNFYAAQVSGNITTYKLRALAYTATSPFMQDGEQLKAERSLGEIISN
jgi:hypothetical protein